MLLLLSLLLLMNCNAVSKAKPTRNTHTDTKRLTHVLYFLSVFLLLGLFSLVSLLIQHLALAFCCRCWDPKSIPALHAHRPAPIAWSRAWRPLENPEPAISFAPHSLPLHLPMRTHPPNIESLIFRSRSVRPCMTWWNTTGGNRTWYGVRTSATIHREKRHERTCHVISETRSTLSHTQISSSEKVKCYWKAPPFWETYQEVVERYLVIKMLVAIMVDGFRECHGLHFFNNYPIQSLSALLGPSRLHISVQSSWPPFITC